MGYFYFFIPRKYSLLFLIISASLLTSTYAGRGSKSLNNKYSSAEHLPGSYEESTMEADAAEVTRVHERLLRMNTHDYGRYDPSPALRKPRYKLIPN